MSLLDHAKELRSHQTDAEQRLWYHLRAHRLMDLKFKRQKPVGPYIVDFICHEIQLVIEVDGGQHQEAAEYDRRRDAWLRERGYQVLRFWNNEVMQQTDGVLEAIRVFVEGRRPPSPQPLSRERERGAASRE
ncbi:MAG: endonuclease domain-containing protein [Burkholderiaceae bacterium]